MTPEEKAKELIDAMLLNIQFASFPIFSKATVIAANNCALLLVEEIIKQLVSISPKIEGLYKIEFHRQHKYFWIQVKEEIEKL